MEDYSRGGKRKGVFGFSLARTNEGAHCFVRIPGTRAGSTPHVPPMELDGGTDYYLKPMKLLVHICIVRAAPCVRYRELPLEVFESARSNATRSRVVVTAHPRARNDTGRRDILCTTRDQIVPELTPRARVRLIRVLPRLGARRPLPGVVDQARGQAVGTDAEWGWRPPSVAVVAEATTTELGEGRRRGASLRSEGTGEGCADRLGRTGQDMCHIQQKCSASQRFETESRAPTTKTPRNGDDPPSLFGTTIATSPILTSTTKGRSRLALRRCRCG